MAVVVEASALCWGFRGYLIALLFAINYDKCYYICWNTYYCIDGNSRTAPGLLVGFFILQKTKFLYKKC